jgi:hypothetical protein
LVLRMALHSRWGWKTTHPGFRRLGGVNYFFYRKA